MSPRSPKARLAPCPGRPSCVSTRATDPVHAIAPIPFTGPANRARERLLQILSAWPRTEIIEQGATYLHAVCRSQLFHFPDDVEFEIDEAVRLIHFRSCSRYGYRDFGVNRERMEAIRGRFAAGR